MDMTCRLKLRNEGPAAAARRKDVYSSSRSAQVPSTMQDLPCLQIDIRGLQQI